MKYPVICLKPNDSIVYGFKDEKTLKTADKRLTENGVFNDVTIIDSYGDSYLIREVHVLGWATPFWGYSFKKPGRLVKIEFRLEAKETYSLDDLKAKIMERVMRNSYYRDTFGWEEMENRIASTDNILRLLSFFI